MYAKGTKIPDVILFTLDEKPDPRGFFVETYKLSAINAAGIHHDFIQDNRSYSRAGVLRGLHYQKGMAKLVGVVSGKIFDVALDLREGPHFREWVGVVLYPNQMLYIPEGLAHGFFAMEDSFVSYKCSAEYDPSLDRGVRWDSAGIQWPERHPILSDRDAQLPRLDDLLSGPPLDGYYSLPSEKLLLA
jgi:dTDP-4-dehydrorhamnose 3,5-epimerase